MAKDISFKNPTEDGDYKYVLVVYDRPGSMLGPAHDMYAVDWIFRNPDDTISAYRGSALEPKEIARFHKDFPWFMVNRTEVEFLEPEKKAEDTEEAPTRAFGGNFV